MIKKSFARWMIALALSGIGAAPLLAETPAQSQQQVATADQLKSKAFEALRAGNFKETYTFLSKAAELSNDPALTKMLGWTSQFEQQRQSFAAERQKEFDKEVAEAKRALEKLKDHREVYAIQAAARAHSLSDKKEAFRAEPWVSGLIAEARQRAEAFENKEQWLQSLRLYAQLSSIEPENAEWKDRMKTSTRRLRLLSLYTPTEFKKIQDADQKEREEAEKIIRPETKPTTKPSDDKDDDEEASRVEWRETLRGVRMDMLASSLLNSKEAYFREVSLKKMMLGGLDAVRVVLTTAPLSNEFKGIGDKTKRDSFLGFIDAYVARINGVKENAESNVLRQLLRDIGQINSASVGLPEEVLVSEFADGAFAALDPFSNIIWPSDWEEFQKTTTGQFSGVGIQISSDDSGYLKVVQPIEDSPADRAKIKPDYLVTHIDGKSARNINLNLAVKKITGPPNTKVTLTIKTPKGDSKDYTLVRDTIKVASVKGWIKIPHGWNYFIDPENKIAYLRLTNFSRTSELDLAKAIEELKAEGARGVIFDLRYNPGGLLPVATGVVDRFISNGDIVSTRPDRPDSQNQAQSVQASRQSSDVDLPLVILVNQYSASASEIVSGALKDHKRALIVGERTFGKGSVQILYPLGGGQAMLRLTTSHYYLPNGKCIHREENSKEWGVEPDVVVEMTPEQMRAAIDARQELDILREKEADPTPAKGENIAAKAEAVEDAVKKAEKKGPLESDAQLSAALLLMRLQLAGATL